MGWQGFKAFGHFAVKACEDDKSLGKEAGKTINKYFVTKESLLTAADSTVSHQLALYQAVNSPQSARHTSCIRQGVTWLLTSSLPGHRPPLVSLWRQAHMVLIYCEDPAKGVAKLIGFSAIRLVFKQPDDCSLPPSDRSPCFAIIEALYCVEEAGGKGLASEALRISLEWARARGAQAVMGELNNRNVASLKTNLRAGTAGGYAYGCLAHLMGWLGVLGSSDLRIKYWKQLFKGVVW